MAITLKQIKQERARRAGLQRIADERARRQQPEQQQAIAPQPPTGQAPVDDRIARLAGKAVQEFEEQKALEPGLKRKREQEAIEREKGLREQEIFEDRFNATARFVRDEGPRLGLSIAGGMLGGPVGAGVGGGIGETTSEFFTRLTESEKTGETLPEIVQATGKEAVSAGIAEGLWDLGGGVVAKAGGKIFSPVIKKIAPKAAAFMDVFTKAGGKFSPAELDRRGLIKFLESASRNSLEGKQLFKAYIDEPANRALIKMTKVMAGDMAEGVGKLEPDMVADALVNSIKGIDSSFDEVFSPAWTQLDELTEGATVRTDKLKAFAEKELLELEEIKGIGGSAELGSLLNQVNSLEEFVSFKGMRRIKRDLFRKVKSLNISGDIADGVAKKLGGLAEEAILDPTSMKGASKEAKLLHQNLKSAYRTGKTAFSEAFPSKIIDGLDNPIRKSAVVKRMFPNNSIDNIKNIRNTLTETLKGKPNKEGIETWNKLQRLWFEDLVSSSINNNGKLVSSSLEAGIEKFGPKAVKEILGPEQAKSLRLIRGIAKEKAVKRDNLTFLVRGAQLGGAAAVAAGFRGENDPVTIGSGGTIVLAPAAFALLAGTGKGNALLRIGLKLPKGSKALPGIVLKLNAAIRRERNKNKPAQTKRPTVSPTPELQL